MGNTCQTKYRNSIEYSVIEDDGTPYYKPRSFDAKTSSNSNSFANSDNTELSKVESEPRVHKLRMNERKLRLSMSI